MPSAADRLEFGPPRDAGGVRSFGFALLVHGLLIIALTWGVNWKRSDQSVAFEAEIWSSVPQAAAPKLVEPPPTPPPPPPEPARKAPEVKAAPPAPNVDIALEQEKKRKLLQQQKEREELQAKKEKEQKAREDQAKKLAAQQDAKKLEAKKLEEQKLAKQRDTDKQAQASTTKQRDEQLKRILSMAAGTGAADSTGTAQKSSGPSASYKARLAALFKRNIVFSSADAIQGNPKAIVQVKVSNTGLIMSSRLTKSSGIPAWDDAVLRAVDKSERIPLDENGRVVQDFPVEFGPKD